jgi:hypothetical protein
MHSNKPVERLRQPAGGARMGGLPQGGGLRLVGAGRMEPSDAWPAHLGRPAASCPWPSGSTGRTAEAGNYTT